MKQQFGVYDWDKSAWVNARETSKRQAIQAVRKSSTWLRELPGLEDTTISDRNWATGQYRHKWAIGDGLYFYPANISNELQTPSTGEQRVAEGGYKLVEYAPSTSSTDDEDGTTWSKGAVLNTFVFKDYNPDYRALGTYDVTDDAEVLDETVKLLSYKDAFILDGAPGSVTGSTYPTISFRIESSLRVIPRFSHESGGGVVELTYAATGVKDNISSLISAHTGIPEASMGNTSSTGFAGRTISRLDMLEFTEAFQAENEIKDNLGEELTLAEQRTELETFKSHVEADSGFESTVIGATRGAVIYQGDPNLGEDSYSFWYTDKYVLYNSSDTGKYKVEKSLGVWDNPYDDELYHSKQTYNYEFYDLEISGNGVQTYTPTSSGDYANVLEYSTDNEPYAGIIGTLLRDHLLNAVNTSLLEDIEDSANQEASSCGIRKVFVASDASGVHGTYEDINPCSYPVVLINLDKDALIGLLDLAISKLTTILNVQVSEARETPLGKVLYQFGNLDSILDQNVSKMDEFYLSFYLANFDGMNTMEDQDTATDYNQFEYMVEALSVAGRPDKWRDYFYAVVRAETVDVGTNGITQNVTHHYCIGYVPNWSVISKLPPWQFQTILTGTLTLEYGVPKPKRKKSWMSIIVAVIVIVVVSIATWGTGTAPTAAAVFGATATITSMVLLIAAEITGSESLARASKFVGYVAMVYGLVQGGIKTLLANLSKLSMTTVALAMQVVSAGLNSHYSQTLGSKQRESDKLSEDVDNVYELIADEQAADRERILNFIHGDHIPMRYTNYYTDMYNNPYIINKGRK